MNSIDMLKDYSRENYFVLCKKCHRIMSLRLGEGLTDLFLGQRTRSTMYTMHFQHVDNDQDRIIRVHILKPKNGDV